MEGQGSYKEIARAVTKLKGAGRTINDLHKEIKRLLFWFLSE